MGINFLVNELYPKQSGGNVLSNVPLPLDSPFIGYCCFCALAPCFFLCTDDRIDTFLDTDGLLVCSESSGPSFEFQPLGEKVSGSLCLGSGANLAYQKVHLISSRLQLTRALQSMGEHRWLKTFCLGAAGLAVGNEGSG